MSPAEVELSETCWCGTSVTVKGTSWPIARDHVIEWRRDHRHRPGREVDSTNGQVGFAAPRGFHPATEANRWGAS